MQIKVNDEILFELSEIQKQVICHDINEDEFDADMKRRIEYIVMHKYEQCMKRIKEKYMPLLEQELDAVPTNPEALAALIFARPDYKGRKMMDAEEAQLA